MSFEGFYQILCENDHYSEIDSSEYVSDFVCDSLIDGKKCGAHSAWANLVDDTNCEREGYVEVIPVTERVTRRCNLGCAHIWTETTFVALDKGPLGALARQAEG